MAFGAAAVGLFGGAVQDLFSIEGLRTKAAGSRVEAQQYDLARQLALQNEQFAKTSTEIKTYQAQRGIYGVMGQQRADVAASGFAAGGSALDLMRDSAAQGALHKAVIGQQGLIEEAGYREQAESYRLMAEASRMAAGQDERAADYAGISAVLKGAAGIGMLFA